MELTIENIYAEHHNNVLKWIHSKIRNQETAEELAGDVFVKVHENINVYDADKAKVNTWVYHIAKNVVIDYLRKKNLPTNSLSDMVDEDGNETVFHTDYTNPYTDMVNSELGATIQKAIDSLPETYHNIADMFFLQEQSHEEISTALDVPIGTVKGYIFRAKELLRTHLTNF